MKNTNIYAGYRYSPQIISHAVWLYHRFTLSFRDIEPSLEIRVDIHSNTLPCKDGNDSLTRSGDIRCPMVLVFGKQDPHVTAEGRVLIHQTLSQNDCDFSWHEVTAQHAFMRDEGDRYDAALALQMYKMATDFFQNTLRA